MTDTSQRVIRINLPIYVFTVFYLFSTVKSYLKSFGLSNELIWTVMGLVLYIPLFLCFIKYVRKIVWTNALLFIVILVYIFVCLHTYSGYSIYYHETNGIYAAVLTGCSSFFALLFLGLYYDENSIKDALYYTAILNLAINILKLRYIINQSTYMEYGYDMDFGYKILFSCIVFISVFFHTHRKLPIVLSGVCVILLLLYGSRGPVLCIVTYVFLYFIVFRLKEYDSKKKVRIIAAFISFLIIAYIYYSFISPLIDLSRLPRTVRAVLNLGYSDGTNESRIMLQNRAKEIIDSNGFWGSGLLSDQAFMGVGRYCHNLLIELQVTFGRVPGIAFFAIILFRSVIIIRDDRVSDTTKNIYLIFLSLCMRLMVSYSFWYDINFWCLIAIGNAISFRLHYISKLDLAIRGK